MTPQMTLTAEQRALLGLDEATSLTLEGAVAPPQAEKLGAKEAFLAAVALFQSNAAVSPLRQELRGESLPASLMRADAHPAVIRVDDPRAIVTGDVVEVDGRPVINATAGVAVARMVDARGEHVIVVSPQGEVQVFASLGREWRALDRWEPMEVAHAPAPDLADVAGGTTLAPWLAGETSRLASHPGVLPRTAAAGLVARLHVPTGQEGAARLAALVAGAPRAVDRAAGWVAGLAPDQRRSLRSSALSEADRLSEELEPLMSLAATSPAAAAARAARWLDRRDDLESVAVVLHRAGDEAADVLRSSLKALDVEAACHHAVFSTLPMTSSERRAAVRTTQPHLWWGALA